MSILIPLAVEDKGLVVVDTALRGHGVIRPHGRGLVLAAMIRLGPRVAQHIARLDVEATPHVVPVPPRGQRGEGALCLRTLRPLRLAAIALHDGVREATMGSPQRQGSTNDIDSTGLAVVGGLLVLRLRLVLAAGRGGVPPLVVLVLQLAHVGRVGEVYRGEEGVVLGVGGGAGGGRGRGGVGARGHDVAVLVEVGRGVQQGAEVGPGRRGVAGEVDGAGALGVLGRPAASGRGGCHGVFLGQ